MRKITILIATVLLFIIVSCSSDKKEKEVIEDSSSIEQDLDKALQQEFSDQDSDSNKTKGFSGDTISE